MTNTLSSRRASTVTNIHVSFYPIIGWNSGNPLDQSLRCLRTHCPLKKLYSVTSVSIENCIITNMAAITAPTRVHPVFPESKYATLCGYFTSALCITKWKFNILQSGRYKREGERGKFTIFILSEDQSYLTHSLRTSFTLLTYTKKHTKL